MAETKIELLTKSSGETEQPFRYSVGKWGSKFLQELRDRKKFLGIRCPRCKKVYVPPRQVCGPCFQRMEELVEISDQGTLVAFTIIRFSFIDPETGVTRPVPYGYGLIQLDGCDNEDDACIKKNIGNFRQTADVLFLEILLALAQLDIGVHPIQYAADPKIVDHLTAGKKLRLEHLCDFLFTCIARPGDDDQG